MLINSLIAAAYGLVEGVTEWLPISSTGHMILLEQFLPLNHSDSFSEMFMVVVQLGAILAVVTLYWRRLLPIAREDSGAVVLDRPNVRLWGKILAATVPAAIVGVLFDDAIDAMFYNWQTVAIALAVFGILFIVLERRGHSDQPRVTSIDDITYPLAIWVGACQLVAAVFPGTSRSGATILGGLAAGMSRAVAAEFTFLLAVPVMVGASALKLAKFGFAFSGGELMSLAVGTAVAYIVSLAAIRLLVQFVQRHDFEVFGWYRIALAVAVASYFWLIG